MIFNRLKKNLPTIFPIPFPPLSLQAGMSFPEAMTFTVVMPRPLHPIVVSPALVVPRCLPFPCSHSQVCFIALTFLRRLLGTNNLCWEFVAILSSAQTIQRTQPLKHAAKVTGRASECPVPEILGPALGTEREGCM